jgi:hypothetical protein
VLAAGLALNLLFSDLVKVQAIIGVMKIAKGIFVIERSPYIKPLVPAVLNCDEFFLRQGTISVGEYSGNVERTWKYRNWIWRIETLHKWECKGFWKRKFIDGHIRTDFRFIGWRLPEIPWIQFDCRLGWRDEGIDNLIVGRRNEPDVGTQLPVFGVLANLNLHCAVAELVPGSNEQSSGKYRINRDACRSTYFKSKLPPIAPGMLFVIFIVLFGKGYERFVYGSKLYGAAAMMFGWLLGVAAVWITMLWFLAHAENVSTALGNDASATCYGRAENVSVLPIVVPEFKLGYKERHIFTTHLWNAPNRPTTRRSTRSIDQTEPTASPPSLTRWSMVTPGV